MSEQEGLFSPMESDQAVDFRALGRRIAAVENARSAGTLGNRTFPPQPTNEASSASPASSHSTGPEAGVSKRLVRAALTAAVQKGTPPRTRW